MVAGLPALPLTEPGSGTRSMAAPFTPAPPMWMALIALALLLNCTGPFCS